MLKVIGIILLVVLLVLVGMNFLIVSNAGDRLRALQTDVDALKARATPAGGAGAETPFDAETAAPFAGDGSAPATPTVALATRPIRAALVALTETIDADGVRMPVSANAVVLLPGVPGQVPLGREAGCVPTVGEATGAWVLTLDGGTLRIASRNCSYPKPVRGRLRGTFRP